MQGVDQENDKNERITVLRGGVSRFPPWGIPIGKRHIGCGVKLSALVPDRLLDIRFGIGAKVGLRLRGYLR